MAYDPKKKVINMSDEELTEAGFLGDGASESIKRMVQAVRSRPDLLDWITVFMLECLQRSDQREQEALELPTSQGPWGGAIMTSSASDSLTIVEPHLISEFERKNYYHGISTDPPHLLYRSDLESNPFPLPLLGAESYTLPVKSVRGVFRTPLNAVWDIVAPMIIASLKKRGIKYSSITTARFYEEEKETLGPIVVWIATHPETTTAENARDASPEILKILEDHKVEGAVVEWYEGSVERL